MSHTPNTPSLLPPFPPSLHPCSHSASCFFSHSFSLSSILGLPPALPLLPLPIISSSVLPALGLLHIGSLVSSLISPFFFSRQHTGREWTVSQSLSLFGGLCLCAWEEHRHVNCSQMLLGQWHVFKWQGGCACFVHEGKENLVDFLYHAF